MPAWLDNAIFYEIYPQSFQDTNADGISDLRELSTVWIISGTWAAMLYGLTLALILLSPTPDTMWPITKR